MHIADTNADICVLKFGSSVLRSPSDLPDVVAEVYRHLRSGSAPVVVVSAFRGRTDQLHRLARDVAPGSCARSALLGSGELEAAAAVAVALERSGLAAQYIEPFRIGITASGNREESWPATVDPQAIREALDSHVIPVVPGYVASGEDGSPHLLGRGGSDLTAIGLGAALHAKTLLIKGSGAIYEWDPAEPGPRPKRFITLGFDDLLALGDRVVQSRAVAYAKEKQVEFTVTGLRGTDSSHIVRSTKHAKLSETDAQPTITPRRIALFGLGVIGGGVAELLIREPTRFEVIGALVRDIGKARAGNIGTIRITTDVNELLEAKPDLVVEAIGGVSESFDLALQAIRSNADYVTANKALLAKHGAQLQEVADEFGRRIIASAAVGGALPVLELAHKAKATGSVVKVRGILNGTTNFILARHQRGHSLAEATDRARESGYAEADVRGDLDGTDASQKLVLLARALGCSLDSERDVHREPLTESTITSRPGLLRRQVAELDLSESEPIASVRLLDLRPDDLLVVDGAGNAIEFILEDGTTLYAQAQGAGRWPTAQSVLADIDDLLATADSDPTHLTHATHAGLKGASS